MKNQFPKRKRGVVLTLQGWQRLQEAQRQSEIHDNAGNPYTLEELNGRTNLSPNTITKIQRRQVPVDRLSLECYFKAFHLTLDGNDYTKPDLNYLESYSRFTLKGQIPLDSPFYIERPPIESLCYETVLQPGALIRIKAPKLMGKSSLMIRILDSARNQGFQTVTLSLQLADAEVFTSLSRFLQWFCAVVTRTLGLPNQLNDYWDDVFGSNYNCTDYFENYLLPQLDSPIVVALDDLDIVFNYPKITTDFFGMLRAWHQKAKYGDKSSKIWQNLRLLVIHSTEVYIPLNINQSPFNVGLSIELPEFTPLQVEDLAQRHHLNWGTKEVKRLMNLIGGNPYLVQVALHHISIQDITLEQLLESPIAEDGIYKDYLRRQLWNLQQYPDLVTALTRIVMSETPVKLDPIQVFKLQSMGLLGFVNQQVVPSCELYRQYFSDRLARLRLNLIKEHRLATIVFINAVDLATKMESDAEQTQNLLDQDFQLITHLSGQYEGQVLKSTSDGLFIYFPSTINAVNCAHEIQLTFRQIAELTSEPVLTYRIAIHLGDVVFGYANCTGNGVDVAACIETETIPGGICISQAVYDAVRAYLPLQPMAIGSKECEGMEELIQLYQLTF